MSYPDEYVLGNARLVLADHVAHGYLCVAGGKIVEVGTGKPPGPAMDMEGDYLLPGLIELHTDHLEAHFMPRAKVRWSPLAAVVSYDAQIAASGITTVFDSLRVGKGAETDGIADEVHVLADAILEAGQKNMLRSEHLTHLRCEIATEDVVDVAAEFMMLRKVNLISLMDHTPGQRQFRDMQKMRDYYVGQNQVLASEFEEFLEVRRELHAKYAVAHRARLVDLAHRNHVPMASHDDATLEHVREAVADRVKVAEFPTSIEAAAASHQAGIKVMMGAPNIVRGGSHSGNVSASELAQLGYLDILSSDYVPNSLLLAAFELPDRIPNMDLAAAIATVTKNPALATDLVDRGELSVGKRADMVRVMHQGSIPVVRCLWREGKRVA